jgi:hypothetical protein
MSLTAAIDVLFSLNFVVVVDFMYMYLRFRPSKAKSTDNALKNGQNAANFLLRFLFLKLTLFAAHTLEILKTERYCQR